jgi:micrococcal nuclease
MDELTPHRPRRPRRRRLRLTSLIAAIISAAIIAYTQAAPAVTTPPTAGASPSPTPTSSLQHVVDDAKDAVLGAQPGLWHVSHVVDGDTINVTLGNQKETVRLLGIDTPETHDPRKPVQCFGETAAAHTQSLLEGKNVRLEPDPTDSDRDKYHRLLRYVYLPDGTLVNAELVRDGYAFAYTVFPLVKLDEFRALEAEARDNNRGLWAGCNINDSSQIKQTTSAK